MQTKEAHIQHGSWLAQLLTSGSTGAALLAPAACQLHFCLPHTLNHPPPSKEGGACTYTLNRCCWSMGEALAAAALSPITPSLPMLPVATASSAAAAAAAVTLGRWLAVQACRRLLYCSGLVAHTAACSARRFGNVAWMGWTEIQDMGSLIVPADAAHCCRQVNKNIVQAPSRARHH